MAFSGPPAATTQQQSMPGAPGPERPVVIHTERLTKIYAGADFAAVDSLDLDVSAGRSSGSWARTALEKRRRPGCLRRASCPRPA